MNEDISINPIPEVYISIKRIEFLLEQILSIQAQQFAILTNRDAKETTDKHFENVRLSLEAYAERLGVKLQD